MDGIWTLYRSTVGKKLLMALTGLGLTFFVLGHLSGNLLLFKGREAMNAYAHWIQSQGPLLWLARGGLLATFLLHIVLGVQLRQQARAARPVRYAFDETLQASWASRTMIITGLVVLSFVIFHLLHFTFGAIQPQNFLLQDGEHRDVYGMVVRGFQNHLVSLLYVVSVGLLAFHLSHGLSSMVQTLGFHHARYWPWVQRAGIVVAWSIFAGFASLPAAVLLGIIKENAQ